MEEKLDQIEAKVDQIEDKVEDKLDQIEDKVEEKVDEIKAKLDADGDGKVELKEATDAFLAAAGTFFGAVGAKAVEVAGNVKDTVVEKAPVVMADIKEAADKAQDKIQEMIAGAKGEATPVEAAPATEVVEAPVAETAPAEAVETTEEAPAETPAQN